MLFTSEYDHTIDAKQRLAIPADVRSQLGPDRHGQGFYLVPGPNGRLWLWPERTFEQMAAALEQSLLPGEEQLEFEELLFSQSTRLEMDAGGRVRLPERMLRRFGLQSKVTVLGVRDHLELCDTDQWHSQRDRKLDKQPQIMLAARRALLTQQRRPGGQEERP